MADESWTLDAPTWEFLDRPKTYCEASKKESRPLKEAPTRRQFKTAREILKRFQQDRGVLLADDVGLGKTTIGALIAWIVAGTGGCVRVLAPNDVMKRRWAEELEAHIPLLNKTAKALKVSSSQLKVNRVDRLRRGRIQVGTHHQLVKNHTTRSSGVDCDLMIIDEAHRAKGENSIFNRALNKHGHRATRKLILTATPFSIAITELSQLLGLVGGRTAGTPVREYAQALSRLYQLRLGVDVTAESDRLATSARKAINAISPFVIRHSINDLSEAEKIHFGEIPSHPLQLKVPRAEEDDIELLLRADRLFRLAIIRHGARTNDPRFHVGWDHLRRELKAVSPNNLSKTEGEIATFAKKSAERMLRRKSSNAHPKTAAVADTVAKLVKQHEKVLIFCHHHATAMEVLTTLEARLGYNVPYIDASIQARWKFLWENELWSPTDSEYIGHWTSDALKLRDTFIDWLCSPGIIHQVCEWIPDKDARRNPREEHLNLQVRRRPENDIPTIKQAAESLLKTIADKRSTSTIGILRAIRHEGHAAMPGVLDQGFPVMGSFNPTEHDRLPKSLYQRSADMVVALFNSPFWPDVLVTTDKLSEGVDLHRCCRHLIHYELDPSPIRILQRNGRIRRVGSWASLLKKPIEYMFPVFEGTRDAKAVEIMTTRLKSFDLLLGGVPDVDVDAEDPANQSLVSEILCKAKKKLTSLNRKLCS